MSWKEIAISALGRVVTGKTPETKNRALYEGIYAFVTPSDIGFNHYVCETTEMTVTDLARDRLPNQFIPGGSVIVTCIGNTIGKTAIAATECLTNQQMNSIVVNESHDAKFVYYLMCHNVDRIRAVGLGGGAAQPIINKNAFSGLKVRVPEKMTQTAVARHLAAYDDLIANNTRRIELLERSARLLFEEWFVRFRYPGHEHDKIVSGVPKGWARSRLGEIADTNPESFSNETLPNEITYVDISSVKNGRILDSTRLGNDAAPGRARRRAKDGDVIWSNVRPNLRQFALVLDPSDFDVFSTGFTILSPTSVPFTFLYAAVTTDAFVAHLVNHTTGVSYPAVRPDDFERAALNVPPIPLLKDFHDYAEPLFRLCHKLWQANAKLAKARALLLPRLMDGRIEV